MRKIIIGIVFVLIAVLAVVNINRIAAAFGADKSSEGSSWSDIWDDITGDNSGDSSSDSSGGSSGSAEKIVYSYYRDSGSVLEFNEYYSFNSLYEPKKSGSYYYYPYKDSGYFIQSSVVLDKNVSSYISADTTLFVVNKDEEGKESPIKEIKGRGGIINLTEVTGDFKAGSQTVYFELCEDTYYTKRFSTAKYTPLNNGEAFDDGFYYYVLNFLELTHDDLNPFQETNFYGFARLQEPVTDISKASLKSNTYIFNISLNGPSAPAEYFTEIN